MKVTLTLRIRRPGGNLLSIYLEGDTPESTATAMQLLAVEQAINTHTALRAHVEVPELALTTRLDH